MTGGRRPAPCPDCGGEAVIFDRKRVVFHNHPCAVVAQGIEARKGGDGTAPSSDESPVPERNAPND